MLHLHASFFQSGFKLLYMRVAIRYLPCVLRVAHILAVRQLIDFIPPQSVSLNQRLDHLWHGGNGFGVGLRFLNCMIPAAMRFFETGNYDASVIAHLSAFAECLAPY